MGTRPEALQGLLPTDRTLEPATLLVKIFRGLGQRPGEKKEHERSEYLNPPRCFIGRAIPPTDRSPNTSLTPLT